jgi:hypothetical protein
MYIAFLIATVTLLIPTVLPMLRHEVWWVRGFDFPRLQLCCLLLVLLFHSTHFTLAEIHRLPDFGSDHFPLLAELVLETGIRDEQEGLQGNRQDYQLAEEKVRDENVSERDVPEPDKH